MRGDTADFDALVRPHVDHLYRLAFRFTGSREEAEDLVQDLLVKLYPRTGELAAVEDLRPWLTRVLYRMFVDSHRKRTRRRVVPIGEAREESEGDPSDQVPSDTPGPEEETETRYTRARLQNALRRLGDHHRAVVALHDMEGYTLAELETLLEVPAGTLKSRLHRARARLRELLDADGTL
ncbi:RNA polymerase sigma-70 factor, ECF subfamily [Thiohalorhabdus denitrificans]|uniref:RNA polymerase sigma-70 factor, ECF subfamily n=1 Tax=Thiohalorhabdus denitrificans TaxID=381306 RepID=A0A1G5BV40_9GAMM|nr:RNA polymerase sigma-70 factor, ECF subfamily [Thiohalorhabdus denitrificans]